MVLGHLLWFLRLNIGRKSLALIGLGASNVVLCGRCESKLE